MLCICSSTCAMQSSPSLTAHTLMLVFECCCCHHPLIQCQWWYLSLALSLFFHVRFLCVTTTCIFGNAEWKDQRFFGKSFLFLYRFVCSCSVLFWYFSKSVFSSAFSCRIHLFFHSFPLSIRTAACWSCANPPKIDNSWSVREKEWKRWRTLAHTVIPSLACLLFRWYCLWYEQNNVVKCERISTSEP